MLRKAQFAGSFYDSDPVQLKQDFDRWFDSAKIPEIQVNLTGVICPHAGYMYSGLCAAHSYKMLSKKKFDTVIILHPSHRGNHFNFSVSPFTEYQTPLGNLKRNDKLAYKLLEQAVEKIDSWYHENEHSMEVQLPFLAYINPQIRVLPIMIGAQNANVSKILAEILSDIIDDDTAVIVSTDLSHYHSAEEARSMDKMLISNIINKDIESFNSNVRIGKTEACGFAGIMTLMFISQMSPQSLFREILYTHSGITSGDYEQVVGYLSAIFTKG